MQKIHKNSITDISQMPSLLIVESFSEYCSVKDSCKLGANEKDSIKSSQADRSVRWFKHTGNSETDSLVETLMYVNHLT
jgi:hypothetical protein